MRVCKTTTATGVLLVLAFMLGACSPQPYLKVFYQLPPASDALEGKRLSLDVAAEGNNEISVSPGAEKSLKDFNNTFTLVVRRENGTGDLVGIYRLLPLLSEIFTRRLQQLGVRVLPPAADNGLALKITLKHFKLDLVEGNWVVDMAYRADLIQDGRMLSGQTISGEARRLKIMGKSEVEKITGELLSDMANRLDVVQLFQQARR